MKKTEDIMRIMAAGGHVELTGNKSVEDLVALAGAAAKNKVAISISGSKKVDDLIRIVGVGRGRVTVRF